MKHLFFLILAPTLFIFAESKSPLTSFFLPGGNKLEAEFLYMKNDTVYVKVQKSDSTSITKAVYKSAFEKVVLTTGETVDLTLSHFPLDAAETQAEKDPWDNIGVVVEENKPVDTTENSINEETVIHSDVDTDKIVSDSDTLPDAVLESDSLKDIGTVDRTPQIKALKTDTLPPTKIKTERKMTTLQINSIPSEVELYFNSKQSINKKPRVYSPHIIDILHQDTIAIHFFKVGYKDTTINYEIMRNALNSLNVELLKFDNPKLIKKQNVFIKRRKQRRISRPLFIASCTFAATSLALSIKANDYYERAISYKRKLEEPNAILDRETYEINKGKNERRVDSWKQYRAGAWGFLGLAALGSGIGLTLYF